MLFEIINNAIENFLICIFIIIYIEFAKQKIKFILSTVVVNTILSTVLTQYDIIGFSQTLIIQCVICFFLYRYHDKFSFQNVVVSFFCNILLYFAVYSSVIVISLICDMKPFQIYATYDLYICNIVLSKVFFILMITASLIKKPLLFARIKIEKIYYFLALEMLITMLIGYNFLTSILNKNYSFSSSLSFFFFILLFFYFVVFLITPLK